MKQNKQTLHDFLVYAESYLLIYIQSSLSKTLLILFNVETVEIKFERVLTVKKEKDKAC